MTGLELEIKKLELEQKNHELEIELRRLELDNKHTIEKEKLKLESNKGKWDSWLKFFTVLITVAIGTYGVAHINNVYQEKQSQREEMLKRFELQLQQEQTKAELQLQQGQASAERRQAEMKYLGEYLNNALQDDIVRRLRFAEYFAALTVSEDLKDKWGNYYKELEALNQEAIENLPKLQERVAALRDAGEIELANELEKQLFRLELEGPLVELAPLPEKPLPEKPLTVMEVVREEARTKFGLDENGRPLTYTENNFEGQGNVIIDHATGLMWQKSGSDKITYQEAQKYIQRLNDTQFAGHDDWRLPTIEELISLLEQEKQSHGLYINSEFDATQPWCWSADLRSSGSAWGVNFDSGYVDWLSLDIEVYARAVRS